MSFGERLKEARILSGMRQVDAAKAMGMSRPTLSAIEADKRPLRASEVHEFAALYHVSTASLMEDEGPVLEDQTTEDTTWKEIKRIEADQNAKDDKKLARLLQYQKEFQKLSKKKQEKVLKYIRKLQDEG
jgi:transcriptional regulator with XRE-family HTH domain